MLRLITDEDLNGRIVRGLLRRLPSLDLIRAQDTVDPGTSDLELLAHAADARRVLVTHDANTMTRHAFERITLGEPMAGLIVIAQSLAIGTAIDELVLIAECTETDEWRGQIVFLPL